LNKNLTNLLKFLIFIGTGFGILYLVYQKQNAAFIAECGLKGIPSEDCSLIKKVIADFKSTNYLFVIAAIAAFIISNLSRSIRWSMLIHPLGYRPKLINAFLTTHLMYFANLGFPRLGEVVRPGTLSKYENIPVDKLMGTSVMDRIMDVVCILIVTALVLALEYQNIFKYLGDQIAIGDKIESLWQSKLLWIGVSLFTILAIVAFVFRTRLLQISFVQKVISFLKGIFEGLKTIGQLEKPGLFILHSINIWVMYYLMTLLLMSSFAPTSGLPLTAALLVFVMGGWGIVIPSPGGMGTYHFCMWR